MNDERRRRLEQAALAGDPEAIERLKQEEKRTATPKARPMLLFGDCLAKDLRSALCGMGRAGRPLSWAVWRTVDREGGTNLVPGRCERCDLKAKAMSQAAFMALIARQVGVSRSAYVKTPTPEELGAKVLTQREVYERGRNSVSSLVPIEGAPE